MELCRKLTAPSWIAVGLQNDLWSWPKERDAAEQLGQSHVINALWVIMQEHQVDMAGAEAICRQLIKENVAEALKIWEENQFNDSISVDLRKYIECMLFSISGNVVWSLGCPRYNPGSNFNEKQLDWMRNGLPDMENLARTHSRDSSTCTFETQASSEAKADSELTSPLEGSVNDGSVDMEQDINCRHPDLSISLQMQQEVITALCFRKNGDRAANTHNRSTWWRRHMITLRLCRRRGFETSSSTGSTSGLASLPRFWTRSRKSSVYCTMLH